MNKRKQALFLDRDGVINKRPVNDYVKNVADFVFLTGSIEAIALLSGLFSPIVVVTNQQGIGKGIMTTETLHAIHQHMLQEVVKGGGKIDSIYYCGDLKDSGSIYRKPAVGMGLQAKKEFPGISFKQSVMVGDTLTDMIFGKRLHMQTVLIDFDAQLPRKYPKLIDQRFPDLRSFAEYCSILKKHSQM